MTTRCRQIPARYQGRRRNRAVRYRRPSANSPAFDALFCNLKVAAGEQAGILIRCGPLATTRKKCWRSRARSNPPVLPNRRYHRCLYHHGGHHDFRHPGLQRRFQEAFGADLPANIFGHRHIRLLSSNYWWAIFCIIGGPLYAFLTWNVPEPMQVALGPMDRLPLRAPVFGNIEKSVIARWTRTLSTMFAPACRSSNR